MLDEKENAVLHELDFRFKANPLPAHVKMALFHDIHEKTKLKDREPKEEVPVVKKEKKPWLLFDLDSRIERLMIRSRNEKTKSD